MGGHLVRGLWAVVFLSVAGCASTQDPAHEAAIARAQESCQRDDCECEEKCHVDIVGCPFREDVCERGLEACVMTCTNPEAARAARLVFAQ